MANGWGFRWIRPPSQVAKEVEGFGAKIMVATLRAGNLLARMAESDAKSNAPWQDQTGAARAGIRGVAEQTAILLVTIYLFHTVEYGKWLEIAMGMRYQIINPTLIKFYPVVWVLIRQELGT